MNLQLLLYSISCISILFLSSCHDTGLSDPCSIEQADNATYYGEVICFDDQNIKSSFPALAQSIILDSFLIISIESLDSLKPLNVTDTVSLYCLIWEGYVTHILYSLHESEAVGHLGEVNRLIYDLPFLPCPDSYFEGFIEQ